MTARAVRPPSLATEVTTDLGSVSSTTNRTVELLRTLLGLESPSKGIKAAPKRPQVSKSTKVASSQRAPVPRSGRNTKARETGSFEIYDGVENEAKPLPPAGRFKLATESFNASLRCLTDLLKQKTPSQAGRDGKIAATRASSPCGSGKPLRQRSPNKKMDKQTEECQSRNTDSRYDLVADCAVLSLRYLQGGEDGGARKSEAGSSQHDRAGLMLLDKLISLSFVEKASNLAIQLFLHYQSQSQPRTTDTSAAKKMELCDILAIEISKDSTAEFTFVTAFQSQLLRLVILTSSMSTVNMLLQHMKLETAGSPASNILNGKERGCLDQEKAALQLRTISQALLKVYSNLTEVEDMAKSPTHEALFNLLVQAFNIKIKSWQLLGHKLQPEKELWIHLIRGGKKLLGSVADETPERRRLVITSCQSVQVMLKGCHFASELPSSTTLYLVDLAEQNSEFELGLDLLQQYTSSLHMKMRNTFWILGRKAVLTYKAKRKPMKDVLAAFQAVSTNLDSSVLEEPGFVLLGTRVRKLSVAIILASGKRGADADDSNYPIKLVACCMDILMGLLELNSKYFLSLLSGSRSQDRNDAVRLQTMSLTLAKCVESILDIGRSRATMPNDLQDRYPESLRLCLEANLLLQHKAQESPSTNDLHATFIESLSVRISNLFWHYFVEAVESASDSLQAQSMLDNSIAGMKYCRLEIQKASSLGTKLEQRGVVKLQSRQYTSARDAFEETLRFYFQIGALAELAEIELESTSSPAAEPGKQVLHLRKLLRSYTELMLTHELCSERSGGWYYDDTTLSVPQRIILLATQLLASAEHTFSERQHQTLYDCIRRIMELTSTSKFRVFQTRLILKLLYLSSKHPSFSIETIITEQLVEQTCNVSYQDEEPYLLKYQPWLACALHLQWHLETGCSSSIFEASKQICSILRAARNPLDLEGIVDDIPFCIRQLEVVLAYAQAVDHLDCMQQCEITLCHVLELQTSPSNSIQLISHLSSLGLIYNRMDDITQAGQCFIRAEGLLSATEGHPAATRYRVSLAEYLINKNEFTKAMTVLNQARLEFSNMHQKAGQVSGRTRLEYDTLLAHSALVSAQLAHRCGRLDLAAVFSRQAIKISTSTWQAVQQSQRSIDFQSEDSTLKILSANMSKLSVSSISQQRLAHFKTGGSAYWSLIHLHCAALAGIAATSLHNGLYQDAQYYLEQNYKIATSTGSFALQRQASIKLGELYAKAGDLEKARPYIMSSELDELDDKALDNAQLRLLRIELLINIGHLDEANTCFLKLQQVMKLSDSRQIATSTTKKAVVPTRRTTTKQTQTRTINAAPKRARGQKSLPREDAETKTAIAAPTLNRLRAQEMLYVLDTLLLSGKNIGSSSTTAGQQPQTVANRFLLPQSKRLIAKSLLNQALVEMSSDAVKCVLAETAVALPVKTASRRASGRVSLVQSDRSPVKASVQSRQTSKPAVTQRDDPKTLPAGEKLLHEAHRLLVDSKSVDEAEYTTHDVHMNGKLETKLSLFGSTMAGPFTLSSIDVVLQLLQSKEVASDRGNMMSASEQLTRSKEQVLTWPDINTLDVDRKPGSMRVSAVTASEAAKIPSSWNVVSVSLAEDGTEILLSKLVADQSPFMLRIPLSRSDLDTGDEPEFTYMAAKTEFAIIISKTNASCHDSRGQGNKEARQAWYQERQHLDEQLGDWLKNVENVWLGGFRGLLSPNHFDEEVHSSFERALTKALNMHLPSRQRQASRQDNKIDFHPHVLDLFLGLGHPDDHDLDDAVTDLLYFVIDILQFNGEQNAYDEIDFDALVVEIQDALRACHARIQKSPFTQHTILILDKELEAFPWESLPCLQDQPISRMPSLRAVIQRTEAIRAQNDNSQGYTVSSMNGAYMLNPSSDLPSTEATFRPILEQQLPSFASTTCTPPSESSFQAMLKDHEVFLYFGHGSGAQYIRGRTIRAMDSCAVTLLMGCSSAKMTECGQFESHGMPGYYISGMSGCMAMVGTLWDVTDRDIDRFAVKLLTEWGLIEDNQLVRKVLERSNKKSASIKGKSGTKAKQIGKVEGQSKMTMSLDQAVSKSRDACLLRYLNGAAPVVYGVPVFLQ